MQTIDKLADDLRAILESHIEDTAAAEAIAAWCEKNAGKRLTERNKPAGWWIDKRYAMTYLENDAYREARWGNAQDAPGQMSFLLAHATTNVLIPSPDYLREHNPAHFDAAVKRNNRRRYLLAHPEQVRNMAAALVGVQRALQDVASVIGNDVPDRYDLIRAASLGDVKVGRLML
jgi:hypothetical protein